MVYTICMKKINYPDWVERCHTKGTSIKRVRNGYALYKCTSVYDKEKGYPRSVQKYIGMIDEEKGLIPKRKDKRSYLEYGLSRFIMKNYKRELSRAAYDHNILLVKLGIVAYIFDDISDISLKRSFLIKDDIDDIKNLRDRVNTRRLSTIKKKIDDLLSKDLNEDKNLITSLLLLSVIETDGKEEDVIFDDDLSSLIEKRGLKL